MTVKTKVGLCLISLGQRLAPNLDVNEVVIGEIRGIIHEGLGLRCTFLDDNVLAAVGLAQRAVLAGLATDCKPDTQKRLKVAAEKHRAEHEAALGRKII